MSQHDFNIANQSFPATRTDLNNALVALASNSSGDAEPTTTYANQWWYETDTNTLKFRNEANSAWIEIATLDQSSNNVLSITTQGLTIGATALTATGTEINQLSTITRGSILYGNASGATARLAKGGAGTVLTSDGTDISWAAGGGGGGLEFISSTDISNASTFVFTGFDASKYDIYKLFFSNLTLQTDNAHLSMVTSTDGGSNYDTGSSDYTRAQFYMQQLYGQFTGTLSGVSSISISGSGQGTASGEEGGSASEITIFSPHLAQYTQFHVRCFGITGASEPYHFMGSYNRSSAADVDALRFSPSSGNIASGTFNAYGMVNS